MKGIPASDSKRIDLKGLALTEIPIPSKKEPIAHENVNMKMLIFVKGKISLICKSFSSRKAMILIIAVTISDNFVGL